MKMRILTVALITTAAAAPLQAQSLFATRGLGVPLNAADARVSALGGIGVGLLGFHPAVTNPAELAGLSRRGVTAAFQPTDVDVDVEGTADGTSGTRFPLLSAVFPLTPRLVTGVAFGGYLDQTWGVAQETTIDVGGRDVTATDNITSTGGIAQMRLQAGYALSPTFSVGVGAGLLTGSVERRVRRTFADTSVTLSTYDQRTNWRFFAPLVSVGARWEPSELIRVGASLMAGTDLDATADSVDDGERIYGAPLEFAAGASARLSSVLLVTAGGAWSRMPSTEGGIETHATMRFGGGLEYEGVRRGQRTFPVRLGARWTGLPYAASGEEQPTEWGIGGGLGFRLGDPANPAAVVDFGVERGERSGLSGITLDQGVTEKLWRFTVSLSVFAN